jgi:lipopolysaccharide/colanic/teichoic acid biosynthesis glycosyltransferase
MTALTPRIVIIGASGFVGRQVVPELRKRAARLLLVGRDVARLRATFPDMECCDYDSWESRAQGFDNVVSLTVLNNDVQASTEEFTRVNVELPLEMAERARQAGIRRFINVSSIQALDERNLTPYAVSKRLAAERLHSVKGIETLTIYLAAVHGEQWAGKLAMLNCLPRGLGLALFKLLAAAKPTVHASRLAALVLEPQMGEPAIILSDTQVSQPVYHLAKRATDIAAAVGIVVFFGWLLVLIWLLIKYDSPGPGLFAQPRVGQHGRLFTCYKFRTMRQGTPQLGTHDVAASAVTRIGAWLRRTKCDELPQVWNVLRNEISLVGPRPCLPLQAALIEARRSRGVLALKPGITGLAQVNGIDMSDPQGLAAWDERYLALQSLVLDMKILVATATGGGRGDRVRNKPDDRPRA